MSFGGFFEERESVSSYENFVCSMILCQCLIRSLTRKYLPNKCLRYIVSACYCSRRQIVDLIINKVEKECVQVAECFKVLECEWLVLVLVALHSQCFKVLECKW